MGVLRESGDTTGMDIVETEIGDWRHISQRRRRERMRLGRQSIQTRNIVHEQL